MSTSTLSPHERLGVAPGVSPAELKAAYHAKLKEFPAHSHPQEFKAVREAYEILRKDPAQRSREILKAKSFDLQMDPAPVERFKARLMERLDLSFADVLRKTF
ncbi:MAG: molecular chaperone DnaJ [Cyanobacteria bacterium RI_101]|jgi:curved DNA-binding protein CbpA|nr:molecular chaperone DnaJ [Cyanobacteria bacterium RI_101]